MHDQIAQQAREMWAAAAKSEIPEAVRSFAQEGVAKTSEAVATWAAATRNGSKAFEELLHVAQSGARMVGEKLVADAVANTETALAAAHGVAQARTVSEVARLQASYAQAQLATLNAQGKGLLELSAKVAQETTNAMAAFAGKAAGDLHRTA